MTCLMKKSLKLNYCFFFLLKTKIKFVKKKVFFCWSVARSRAISTDDGGQGHGQWPMTSVGEQCSLKGSHGAREDSVATHTSEYCKENKHVRESHSLVSS